MSQNPSNNFDQAVKFVVQSNLNAGVHGLKGSAPAFFAAASVRAGAKPLVIIAPDGDAASRLAVDVRCYLGQDETARNLLTDDVLRYPSSDLEPYSFRGFENDIWIGRMASLYRLVGSDTAGPRVVSVGLDAIIRRIIPRKALLNQSLVLSKGKDLDRDSLIENLTQAGYSRSPLVEDAGDFSVRGFIIDIYPPVYPYPVRVEQVGDSIESIRFFDPTNQRSLDHVSEVRISPIHMLIPDQESRDRGIQRLLDFCDEGGIEKRVRQRIVDDFRNGLRFPGAECFLPYFFRNQETLFDYLPQDACLVLPDDDSIALAFAELKEEADRGWRKAVEDGLPVPSPDELFMDHEEFVSMVSYFRQITLSDLQVEKPDRVSFRVSCEMNTDIRREMVGARAYDSGISRLLKRLVSWRDDGNQVLLMSHTQGQAQRLLSLLEPYSLGIYFSGSTADPAILDFNPVAGISLCVGAVSSGFRMEHAQRIVLTEEEIFGPRVRVPPRKRARGTLISSLTDLAEGEAVVHEDYGIGIFRGLEKKEFDGIPCEVMVIEYAGRDLLYHPVERLQVIQKYVSGSESPPMIDHLGGKGWAKTKAKVKQSIKAMAKDLLEIYAKRQVSTRLPYSPRDENFASFEALFEFEETPDQARAIQDIMESMDSDKPMDRLVCGDVGYGKTEVAIRAAFRCIMDGKQVAVLVPTTVLAQQHLETFSKRFAEYPITIDALSRFRSSAEQKQILSNLADGRLDLVIATHKLLSKDISFKDLGLLVVDEEHRFGVRHKEKIKKFKAHVDVLTLTATPIPRTLNLSLSGIRDLSVIETPPTNRQSIRTYVVQQSDEVIREALVKELNRGGQVFFLHNRVQTIHKRGAHLQKLVPEGRFGTAHGQMVDGELEQVMLDFVTGKLNILVCTSIIESGLDIPRANTIIIERADTFGLADLYQLRGRVGRSNTRAYSYLLTPPEGLMTPDAIKRLAVIQEHSSLGQGFRIAMRDMEIRGAGNILGTSQSGHVAQVGYEMYLDLLEQAIQEIKGEDQPGRIDPEIRLRLEALIPEDYVPYPQQRMNFYKRLSRSSEASEIDEIEEEIIDLYGRPPVQVSRLIKIMRIRLAMKEIRILKLDYNLDDIVLSFDTDTPLRPDVLVGWAQKDSRVRLLPEDRFILRVGKLDDEERIEMCAGLMQTLYRTIIDGVRALPEGPPTDVKEYARKVALLKTK